MEQLIQIDTIVLHNYIKRLKANNENILHQEFI